MDAVARFAGLMRSDAGFALDEAAFCIAACARREVDVDRQLRRLDELAEGVRVPTLDGLVHHLFAVEGFSGDADRYYDPRNSFLDSVLDRRRGIPISLSVLVMEVGRRVGVPLDGVGMPGHFLLRDKVDPSVFVDPFHRGRLLDARGCRELLASLSREAPWSETYLAPVSRPVIVARMLANLRAIYAQRGDAAALAWVSQLRSHLPGVAADERAQLPRLVAPLN